MPFLDCTFIQLDHDTLLHTMEAMFIVNRSIISCRYNQSMVISYALTTASCTMFSFLKRLLMLVADVNAL